jgi:hypothetical protein
MSLLLAFISVGLSAHLTILIEGLAGTTLAFTVLALAAGCLTIVTLPIM